MLDPLVGPLLNSGVELVVTESTTVGLVLNEGSAIGESVWTFPSSSPSVGLEIDGEPGDEGAESVGLVFGSEVGETDCDDVFDQRQMLVKSNRLTTRRLDMVELIDGSSSITAGWTSER